MPEPTARLYLISPVIDDPAAFAPRLADACGAGAVAAVLLRLAAGDERTRVNLVKALAPAAQDRGAAVLVAADDGHADLAAIAARGGADGVHVAGAGGAIRDMRERLKGDRILGVGGLRSKDDAMTAGEAGADYLMFGDPRADGSVPAFEAVLERAAWWAEIFTTPCAAFAPTLADVAALAGTRVEFVAVSDAVWGDAEGPAAAVRKAVDALARPEART